VGRTGTLNPYAVLEPVSVGGVTIRSAALHNEDDIRRKDIREGDSVIIQRAGEVIPEILGPVIGKRTGREKPFDLLQKLPKNDKNQPVCPACLQPGVIRPEGEVMYYCANAACPAQAQQRIEHFASRGAMDIRGIGENISATLYRERLVKDIAGLYDLKQEQLAALEKMGEKSAANILRSIENSKDRPLLRLIYALGIRHIGEEMAGVLAGRFHSIDRLAQASRDELMEISAIGPKIADSVTAFFDQKENLDIIRRLKEAGVRTEEKAVVKQHLPLSGKEFVLTGTLVNLTRQQAEARIREQGGAAKDNVNRKTDYIVVGAEPGSKLARATELGIEILDEQQFIEKLKKADS